MSRAWIPIALLCASCVSFSGVASDLEESACGYVLDRELAAPDNGCSEARVYEGYGLTRWDASSCDVRDESTLCLPLRPGEPFLLWRKPAIPAGTDPELVIETVECGATDCG